MKKYFKLIIAIIITFTLLIVYKPTVFTYKGYRYFSKLEVSSVYSKAGVFLGIKKECVFSLISRCEIKKQCELEKH